MAKKSYNQNQFKFFENKNRKKRIYIKGNLDGGFIKFLSTNKNKENLNKSIDYIHLYNNNKNFGLNNIWVIYRKKIWEIRLWINHS